MLMAYKGLIEIRLKLWWIYQRKIIYSVLKFNTSNNRGRNLKSWRILGLAGTSTEVEILTAEGSNLTCLSWHRIEGYFAVLLRVNSLCSYFTVNRPSNVAIDGFLTHAKYEIFCWTMGVHVYSMCVKKPSGFMSLNRSVGRGSPCLATIIH